jgi:hypothetical protein
VPLHGRRSVNLFSKALDFCYDNHVFPRFHRIRPMAGRFRREPHPEESHPTEPNLVRAGIVDLIENDSVTIRK